MNTFEVKVFMLREGLTIASMARELCKTSNAKQNSMQTMISDMIYGRRFYPSIAKKLKKKFGLELECSPQCRPAREIIKQAA